MDENPENDQEKSKRKAFDQFRSVLLERGAASAAGFSQGGIALLDLVESRERAELARLRLRIKQMNAHSRRSLIRRVIVLVYASAIVILAYITRDPLHPSQLPNTQAEWAVFVFGITGYIFFFYDVIKTRFSNFIKSQDILHDRIKRLSESSRERESAETGP